MNTKLIVVLIIFAFFCKANAQNGIITGKVIDKNTGENLIGASLTLLNVKPVQGTVTDYNGNFCLKNIPDGKYSLQVKFISYHTLLLNNIVVKKAKPINMSIALQRIDKNIEKVIVSANALRNTDVAVLSKQKKSLSILNGISSESIYRMGDEDAASALKRVSGISVESGKYIFVRGLSDRYSKITLNGAEIPGLDPNKNTVQLDLFSSNIIDNIVVQKTFSPDLPASFAGGYVNIATKSFPDKFIMQISASEGYNRNANLRQDFLLYTKGSKDWLGYDDGGRAIPKDAIAGVPFLYVNNNKLDKISASFNKIMIPSQIHSFLNQNYAFSLGNQIKYAKHTVGFILDLTYSSKYKFYNDGKYSRYNLVGNAQTGIMNPLVLENEIYGQQEIITSALLGISYKFDTYNKIGLIVMRNGAGLSSARKRQGSKPEDNLFMLENTLAYQQRNFISSQIYGSNAFGKSKIKWISSLTKSRLYEPDLRFFNYDSTSNGKYEISYSAYPAPARFYRDLNELNFDNKIHLIFPFEKFKLKFGFSYIFKDRNSQSRKFDILSQGLPFNGNVNDYLNKQNIGQNADAVYGVFYQNDPLTDKYNSYIAHETIAALYAMTMFKLNSKTDIQTGIRYEYDYTFIQNMIEAYQPKFVSAEKSYPFDFLPALNITYHLSSTMNLRFAASRTLARPAFREIAPYAYYDFKEGWRVVGNPDLKRTLIDNLDFRWEKFMKNAQILAISLFMKYFSKPIELIDDPRANNPELHYVNADNSVLYGAEIELHKNLDFVNLKDLSIGTNMTYLKSKVKYVENYGNSSNEDFNVQRPMYGQAPWVINAFVNYDNKQLGISSNLGFNIDGPKLAIVTKGQTPDVYEQPVALLNWNLQKTLLQKLILRFSVSNLLNSNYAKTYTFNDKKYFFQQYSLCRTFSFSLKYIIK